MKKNEEKSVHDEKGTFLMIFLCFLSFLTIQKHAFTGRNTQQLCLLSGNTKNYWEL